MLDSLFTPDSAARRAAEYILEQAARGRDTTARQVMRGAGVDRVDALEARRRLERAGLLPKREGGDDA